MMHCGAAMLIQVHMYDRGDTFKNHQSTEEHTNYQSNYTRMSRFVSQAEQFSTYCMYVPHIPSQVAPGAFITKAVRVHLWASSKP